MFFVGFAQHVCFGPGSLRLLRTLSVCACSEKEENTSNRGGWSARQGSFEEKKHLAGYYLHTLSNRDYSNGTPNALPGCSVTQPPLCLRLGTGFHGRLSSLSSSNTKINVATQS